MSAEDFHSEYPSEAQIEEMWAAYKSRGRQGILEFLRKRTREWQEAERRAQSSEPEATEA